jgi:hypothetical protein
VTTGVGSGTDLIRLLDLRLHWVVYHHFMYTEQMMVHLLAEIRTGQEHIKDMMNKMKEEIKEGMNANRKANQKHMQDMLARMDANRK